MTDNDERAINSAELLLYKAALQIEETDDFKGAEKTLREAVSVAEVAGYTLELIRAKTLLGELLSHEGREEDARYEFMDVLQIAKRSGIPQEQIAEELETAHEGLAGNTEE